VYVARAAPERDAFTLVRHPRLAVVQVARPARGEPHSGLRPGLEYAQPTQPQERREPERPDDGDIPDELCEEYDAGGGEANRAEPSASANPTGPEVRGLDHAGKLA